MGDLDNTLVVYLTADNGCTAEGTPTGTFSELLMQNGFPPLTMEQQLEKLEEFGGLEAWGGPHMANHYSVAGPTHHQPHSSGPNKWPPISVVPCLLQLYAILKPLKRKVNGADSFRM
jgi:arylsulfatase A-like enzyme